MQKDYLKCQYLNIEGLENMNEFILWFGGNEWTFIDGIVTILTLGLVFWNWYQNYVQNKQIKIYILHNNVKTMLPIKLIRKNITRAEINGILGAFDKDSKFCIAHTSSVEFFEDIENIQNGKSNEICIVITENDKFDRVNI
ncbi:hypothetical protein [Aliarcobacter butzleri]|uniref:hypothetical protein n=2 Tax=Aliarcobacter butzleri TaxID=28197 RepID=UPI0021B3A120|nr:hypothetical protein [Aliarcobacter butzleri]MCT7646381.1 hypothetical protein [Aliarcobacter butzleri]